MIFFTSVKEKALFKTAQQVAKADAKAFAGMLTEHRCLRNSFWDFVLDTSNIEKWQADSINALICHSSPEGIAKIGSDQHLQKKLAKKYAKLCQKFPTLVATLQPHQTVRHDPYKQVFANVQTASQPLSFYTSSAARDNVRQQSPSIHIELNSQSYDYTVAGIITTAIAAACIFLLIKFLITALLVLGIGFAAGAVAYIALEENASPCYRS